MGVMTNRTKVRTVKKNTRTFQNLKKRWPEPLTKKIKAGIKMTMMAVHIVTM